MPPMTIHASTVSRRSITRRSELERPSRFAMSSSFVRALWVKRKEKSVKSHVHLQRRRVSPTFIRARCDARSPSTACDMLVRSETICVERFSDSDSCVAYMAPFAESKPCKQHVSSVDHMTNSPQTGQPLKTHGISSVQQRFTLTHFDCAATDAEDLLLERVAQHLRFIP
jgi:hypothetical protein